MVEQQLIRVSDFHNQSLQLLFENMLLQLPNEPIKHLKKALELYAELLALNKKGIADASLSPKLEIWNQTVGLQKTIKLIL